MSKHTKGPWTLEIETDPDMRRISINEIHRSIHDGEWADPEDWDRDLANARLIAAAPDLLQACKEVLDVLQMCNDPKDTVETRGTITGSIAVLESVIAKAEGTAP